MKDDKASVQPMKLKFKDIMSFEFANTMQKISSKETSNKNACHIAKIVRAINDQRKVIIERYNKEITEKFAPKDEHGKVKLDPGGGFVPPDDKIDEFQKLQSSFEESEFEVNWRPLTPSVLADMKLSAKDIELLGPLFSEVEPAGPAIPHLVQN